MNIFGRDSGASGTHHHRGRQRRVRNTLLVAVAVFLTVAIPLTVNDQLRLDVAYRLGFAPGASIERVAKGGGNVSLIVIPFHTAADPPSEMYRYRAQYLATTGPDGTELDDVNSGKHLTIPLTTLDFIAASTDGETIYLRQGDAPRAYKSVVIDAVTGKVTPVADGKAEPDLPGDWTVPIWSKTNGRCGPVSVTQKYVACFPRSHLSQYLAGDWQLTLQVYGDYRQHQDLFRGLGFLPTVGWNDDDTVIWFANENGIWRSTIDPAKLRA